MGRLEKRLKGKDPFFILENSNGCNLEEKLSAFSWLSLRELKGNQKVNSGENINMGIRGHCSQLYH